MSSNKQMLSVKTCIAGLLISTVSMFSFADQTVKVEINVSDVIGQQNPLYYGGNNIYPKGGQGILKANGEFDPVEMNAAKKLGLQSYRFLGVLKLTYINGNEQLVLFLNVLIMSVVTIKVIGQTNLALMNLDAC
ncbi:hypothetical protein [Psychrosphaera algicola]|uniref:Uncharacterized protein n=1 Tax=Psychrosphaera algicola TaxID=3023714 RepID=A0ABT5FC94_9GAMM|nr:hypothetical protein [Psychrosphaera sp. G1-22]MDC2888769.1 hypothetical protein [Psychrosphaera sp. G1-22]